MARGRRRREHFPRRDAGSLEPEAPNRDVVPILERDNAGRIADLVPSRYGRMLESPLAFFRGSVSVMMADIGRLPHSGIATRLCGDCHLANFGGVVTQERRLLFGINDFDHAGIGPFEWDLKRLATSFAIVTALLSSRESSQLRIAGEVVRSYTDAIAQLSRMSAIDIWNSRFDAGTLLLRGLGKRSARELDREIREAAARTPRQRFAKVAKVVNGRPAFREADVAEAELPGVKRFESDVADFLERYVTTLPVERRLLVERYSLFDVRTKLTGIGSFGLRSALALLMAGAGDAVFLQLKQAGRSVLETYTGPSDLRNDALRVIAGQHTMQATSDVFLGWFRSPRLRANFFVRRHDESRLSIDFEEFDVSDLSAYAKVCGPALARAHARSGDPAVIAGYLGKGRAFERAISEFAIAYAERTRRDHARFVEAATAGRIVTHRDN